MKSFFSVLIAVMLVSQEASSQQKKPARLIVRGDDMGFSHSGNEALIKCSKEGIQTSIEVIVPSPWFPEAVKMLKANPGIDVGVHLAITSEWDNMKLRPLSDCPSLKDEDGYFYPMIWPNKNYPGRAVKDHDWQLEDIEKEFRAQIELALKHLPQITHLSGHMGCTWIDESVAALTNRLAKEYKLNVDLKAIGVENAGYEGPHKTLEEKTASFIKMLDKLQPGETYLFVDHPGLDTPELRAIYHVGNENIAIDRQGVTSLWTSEKVKAAIRERNIRLTSYKDLVE